MRSGMPERFRRNPSEQPMAENLCVHQEAGLLAFLLEQLRDWSRNTVKQRLQSGCVTVNGARVVRHDHVVRIGDQVEVTAVPRAVVRASAGLAILYEDRDLVAVDKPAGLLSVGTTRENRDHALAILHNQLSRRLREANLCPVNRIDRDTSGVLLFATSREMREATMAGWEAAEKIYLAVVEGCPVPERGTVDQPLRMDAKEYRAHVGRHPAAKPAVTHYEVERKAGGRTLLRIGLETGRQHQIRAHMAWLGYPVVGDPRYGRGGARMGLHALRLKIVHPATGRELVFEAPVPDDFWLLMGMSEGREVAWRSE